MAHSAIEKEEEKREFFDSPEELETKCEMLAEMIINSQHFVAFTGAGISTACGIPDYRSGYNTVLETGPGCWETLANKKKYANKEGGKPDQNKKINMQKAYPSYTHMALVELQNQDRLKFLISQNVDGLHRKSGIPPHCLAELHGNTNLEVCEKCGREYMRDFRVRNAQKVHEHKTGRSCDNPECGGPLIDTIINFGENLNDNILELGFQNCAGADVCLAMGSSLRVSPACDMPVETSSNGGNLVLINLQKTPIDGAATMIIHGKCDDVMKILMNKLGYGAPTWQLTRRLQLKIVSNEKNKGVQLMGVDSNGAPYQLFKQIQISGLKQASSTFPTEQQKRQPFTSALDTTTNINDPDHCFSVTLTFFEHYAEPELTIKVNLADLIAGEKLEYQMIFDAGKTGKWELVLIYDQDRNMVGPAEFEVAEEDEDSDSDEEQKQEQKEYII